MGVLEERSDGGKGISHFIGCVLYKHMETYQAAQGAPLLFFKYRAMIDNFKKKTLSHIAFSETSSSYRAGLPICSHCGPLQGSSDS